VEQRSILSINDSIDTNRNNHKENKVSLHEPPGQGPRKLTTNANRASNKQKLSTTPPGECSLLRAVLLFFLDVEAAAASHLKPSLKKLKSRRIGLASRDMLLLALLVFYMGDVDVASATNIISGLRSLFETISAK
jgi:hypothetical protein